MIGGTKRCSEVMQAVPRDSPAHWEASMGVMRCLASSADWEALLQTCRDEWSHVDSIKRQEMSSLAAHAAWHLSDWKNLQKFVDSINQSGREHTTSTTAMLRAVLAIQNGKTFGDFDLAERHIARARFALLSFGCTARAAQQSCTPWTDRLVGLTTGLLHPQLLLLVAIRQRVAPPL
jgi:hypothetical protein